MSRAQAPHGHEPTEVDDRRAAEAEAEATAAATPAADDALPVIDAVHNFEKISRIGEGTYGVVYQARDRSTDEIVAIKKIRMERERHGVPVTSLRELRVLQECKHPNIVDLKAVVTGSQADSVFLVFEYVEHDLGRLLDSLRSPFRESEVKCIMLQLLEAVAFLHERWVIHRDLKLSNLLLSNKGVLKLCDFGLARSFRPYDVTYTPNVVTLWYRAPELLLGQQNYTEAVDMWAMGCIFGELLRHKALLPGRTEIQQLELIFKLLGTPSERIWPGVTSLPHWKKMQLPNQPYSFVQQEFPGLSRAGLDLFNRMLCYDPARRISARSALRHEYFRESPYPKTPQDMPTFPSAHNATCGSKQGGSHKAGYKVASHTTSLDARFGEAFGGGRPSKQARLA